MATYSQNTTIKVREGVNGTTIWSGGSYGPVFFTCPANCYAIISFFTGPGGGGSPALVDIDGTQFDCIQNMYIGPGQVLRGVDPDSSSGGISYQGVIFENTP